MDSEGGGDASAGPSTGVSQFHFKTGKKGRILIRARYRHYLHHSTEDGSQMWSCMHKDCPAMLKISGARILREDPHKCTLPSTIITEFKEECLRRSRDEVISITKIYQDVHKCFVDRGYNLVENAVPFKAIKSSMYQESRNSKLNVSKTRFKIPAQVEVPQNFREFLLFQDALGIIGFPTLEGRNILRRSQTCFMDGTFWTCPSPFFQLYSIHVDRGSCESQTLTCSVVFVLLPNKKQHTFEVMLNMIKDNVPGCSPNTFIVDFELAVINALYKIFPNSVTKGCNFHFKQAISKKKREFGITSIEEAKHVAKCGALAHLPIELVEDSWLAIMEEAPNREKMCKFNNYFVSTWLDSASFPLELWN